MAHNSPAHTDTAFDQCLVQFCLFEDVQIRHALTVCLPRMLGTREALEQFFRVFLR